jgi:N-acetylneuraminic acid mutarotase
MRVKPGLMIFWASLIALHLACQSGNDTPPPGPTPISAGSWTWASGGNIVLRQGIYGIKGTSDPLNVPGARCNAVSWMDSSGKFWLFGGHSLSGLINDLWRYDPAIGEWTWVSGSDLTYQSGNYGTQGISEPSNVPGARRDAASWLDPQGRLWLFGGIGQDGAGDYGWLNDLWMFVPATLEWTWVSGSNAANQAGTFGTLGMAAPSNVPGAKARVASWMDHSGNLWLFGGFGFISPGLYGEFNDLWKFNPVTSEWTWVSGSSTEDEMGVYGVRGTADPSNVPGARDGAASWIDARGIIWLFGGAGIDNFDTINDLWKFDPATSEWTWVSGSKLFGQNGIYGTRGLATPWNVPGARNESQSWIDSNGKFWLFGGFGHDSAGNKDALNDLWMFDPATLEWTWVSGGNVCGRSGVYGTLGSPTSSNIPGARKAAISQIDSSGSLWLFGGAGFDSAGTQSLINDLWRYTR